MNWVILVAVIIIILLLNIPKFHKDKLANIRRIKEERRHAELMNAIRNLSNATNELSKQHGKSEDNR